MALTCTRCEGSGFLNLHQVDYECLKYYDETRDHNIILEWIKDNPLSDVQVCDCCGDGENWYGIPGEHYNSNDPFGNLGPYYYNGGLCECH